MVLNKKSALFLVYFGLAIILLAVWGCAAQQKPQGGPSGRYATQIIKGDPGKSYPNFSAKQIQLDFDEYIRLNNQFQQITIFPTLDKRPDFKLKQKSLIITLNPKDTLQKNTTYVINFGEAIADVNEGNKMKNFSYVFSTGPHIDSLSLSGTVTNILTQHKEENATVMLFTLKQDSLLFGKKKPTFSATTDTAGNFTLNNLKEGDYKIYALKEKNPDKIYNDDDELIAFSKNTIHLRHDSTGIKLNLFKQIPQQLKVVRKFNTDGSLSFIFNKNLANPSVHILYPQDLDAQKIVDINKTHDTISVYSKNMDFDSIRVAFYDNNKPVDTPYLRKVRKEVYPRLLILNYGLSRNQSVLKPGTDFHFTADMPIESYDPSLISLKEDTAYVNYTLLKDSSNAKHFVIKYRWKQTSEYTLTFNEGAFTSIYGDKNKKQTKKFLIDKPDNYSTFTLTFNVPDTSKSYLVELLNEQKMLLRTDRITKKTTLEYKDYYTGKYFIQVVYDDNRNGKWDTGSLKQKSQPERQPENIWLDNKSFTTKPRWIYNETIDIPPEVINP